MSNIKVAVRVRPPLESELRNGNQPSWIAHGNTIYLDSGKINALHTFDHVFDSASTNHDVYDKYCHPIVESVMQGFNGTIFAFGQTSSGKTHTMMGTAKKPGLIPLTINAIFNIIENVPEREYLIRVSYIEIYNEVIVDLLDPASGKNLQIRDNSDGQPVISDLTELTVGSKEEIQAAMSTGERHRHVASTEANQRSSRSHTIFRMVIESSLRDGVDRAVTVGQLNLVDLAGSERSEQCGDDGERFRESTRINLSLTFLTQVISKLSRGESGHINFRDSKLTRILRNSLGGNAHTAIVCTVNPFCVDQTLRTLQFASSAKKIQNTPVVNESISNDTLIRRHHREIEKLKFQIREMQATKNEDLCKTLQEKDSLIDELNSKVRSLEAKLVVSTLPAPSVAEWRRQRRETWAAPSSVQRELTKARTVSEDTVAREALDVFQEWPCRLSTVIEESESFHAISTENFERHLQREEQTRRSAALLFAESEPTAPHTCNDVSCAERIKFLENELAILKKDYEELEDLTTLERLMCSTSRRPVPFGKLGKAASTPLLPGQPKECCVKALQTCQRCQEHVSHGSGGFKFFSPVCASPMLPSADGDSSKSSSSTSINSHDDQEGVCVQGSKQCAGLTPRTTLWASGHSPLVGTPGLNPLVRTPQASNRRLSKPLCVGAAQTGDVQCMQMLKHPVTTCTQTHENMLQNILPVVDATCQTDSEDGCENPRPPTGGPPGASATKPVGHSESCDTRKNIPTQTAEVQTIDLPFTAPEELLAKSKLVETSVLCCLGSKPHLDCGTQTETPVRSVALQSENGETERTLFDSGGAQSHRRCCALHEKQRRGINSCMHCGSQALPYTEDSESQVNQSLVNGSIADFAAQATTQMRSYASQVDAHFNRKEALDCAVQCGSLLQNSEAREKAVDVVDCEVQTTLSVQECTVQTELSLLHQKVADCGMQAVPSMLDASTDVDQVSRIVMLDSGAQTELPCFHDTSVQSDCCVLSKALADCEVQAVPFTKDSASQVNSSLESQEIGTLQSTQLSVTMNNCSHLDKPFVSQLWTPSSGSGSTNRLDKPHAGNVWATLKASLRGYSEESAGSKTLGDYQSTPLLSYRNGAANIRTKEFAFGTPVTVTGIEQVLKISLVDTSVHTKSSDRSIQSALSIPRSAIADCDIQAVPFTSDCASQTNMSVASQEVDKPESAQCSANYSSSQLQKSSVSNAPDAAPKPPTHSAWRSASGNDSRLQHKHGSCYGGNILDALRANMLKTAEDSAPDIVSQEVPSSCFRSATSSFQSGTPAPEFRARLHHNQKTKESVAVQADTLGVQELEDLRHKVSTMKLSLDAHEKALRDKKSQLKLQEKASKKRELQLKAVIRQLQNKDTDNMARAALGSPTAAAASAKETEPLQPARALALDAPASLAQRLKAMTPRAREGARLVYFGSSLEEQAVAEQVQMGQLRASLSSHARKLESARKRQQAWAELRSDSKHAVPRSPLEELKEPDHEIKEPAESLKADSADDMKFWPPLKYFMNADKENLDSP